MSYGCVLRPHANGSRCWTVAFKVFWPVVSNCDIIIKLFLGGRRDGIVSFFDCEVLTVRLITRKFITFLCGKEFWGFGGL